MTDQVDAIARAVLYEGYLLYPYRPSSVKNQVRWTFGGLLPRDYSEATGGSDPWTMRTECLLLGAEGCRLDVTVRFLRLLERRAAGEPPWQEAEERAVSAEAASLAELRPAPISAAIRLEGGRARGDGPDAAVTREWRPLEGSVEVRAEPVAEGADRVTVLVRNTTPLPGADRMRREDAVLSSLAATHAVLRAEGGRFVSLADPPEPLREAAAACRNTGAWPVLVGDPARQDTVLASPIILEDFPRVAEESPGDLFDATEIDEILTLRILTMTDEEKAEMRRGDERARRLLERTEGLGPGDLARLHGTIRSLRPVPPEARS